jgi:hypothetical protein
MLSRYLEAAAILVAFSPPNAAARREIVEEAERRFRENQTKKAHAVKSKLAKDRRDRISRALDNLGIPLKAGTKYIEEHILWDLVFEPPLRPHPTAREVKTMISDKKRGLL